MACAGGQELPECSTESHLYCAKLGWGVRQRRLLVPAGTGTETAADQDLSRCWEGWRAQGLRGQAAPVQGGKKRRKQVDRRASKGRKLRYHVHAKLVNFVAPRPPAAEPAFATQLFANLFGRRAG